MNGSFCSQLAMKTSRLSSAMFFPIMTLVLGCGGSAGPVTVPVKGAITVDGKPLPDGYVSFTDKNGRDQTGAVKVSSGTYSLRTTPGEKVVEISATRETGTMASGDQEFLRSC